MKGVKPALEWARSVSISPDAAPEIFQRSGGATVYRLDEVEAIQRDAWNSALKLAADTAEGLRVKCDAKDTEGVVANMRASAIRDEIRKLVA
jgi:hypothetical protein